MCWYAPRRGRLRAWHARGRAGAPFSGDATLATPTDLLTKVDAAIETRLNGGAVESYAIRGRDLRYVALTELFKLRDQLRREVEQEKVGGLPLIYGVKDLRAAAS